MKLIKISKTNKYVYAGLTWQECWASEGVLKQETYSLQRQKTVEVATTNT